MSHVLHRTVTARPPEAVSGKGLVLRLSDGSEILDASGGAAVACIGHGNERVARAIFQQAASAGYVHSSFFTNRPAEELADLLVGHEPGGLTHAFFVSSGSEAMEAALKMARQFQVELGESQRVHFIARRQGYHGSTFGAMAASGNAARRAPYLPLLSPNFHHVSPCFSYRYQGATESDAAYVQRLASELEAEFQRLGPQTVIAFVAETVVGATTGCVAATPGYFRAMRDVCDRHGALLILDEVMSGMGRTGTMHAWEQEGVTPDIQAIGKGLAGGYQPLGAILVSRRVVGALELGSGAFIHGHTYQAHPVACAGALEVQRIIREERLLTRVGPMGETLAEALRARFGEHPNVGDIRGRGLFRALEFVRDRATQEPFDPALKMHDRLKQAALRAGLGVYPTGGTIDGIRGDHAIIAPPYNVTQDEIEMIVERMGRAVDDAISGAPAA